METASSQPTFIVDGNRLTLLDTGRRRLDAVLATIAGARRSLRAIYYIYAHDDTGRQVNQALMDAVGRGVTVSLIVDGFGAEIRADKAFFETLRDGGVNVCLFSPRFGRRYLLRNHQKLLLADAEDDAAARIIVGGFNIEDDYLGIADKPQDVWRDLGLLVEGLAAGRLAGYFDALHEWVHSDDPSLRRLNRALAKWSEHQGPLRWLIGGPTRRLSPWARTVRADIRGGKEISLIAGYFSPSPTILRRLDKAGQRGSTVRIVTAALSDHQNAVAAARFTYAGLLRKGVKIWEYQPSKLHTKLYLIDRAVHIGSANFDMRSLFINLELMMRVEDEAFAAHVRAYFDGEIAKSCPIDKAWYKKNAGVWQRVRQLGAYLLLAVVDPSVSRGLNS